MVPGATVTLAGWKLSDWSEPTFWGITIVIEEAWALTGSTRAVVKPRARIARTTVVTANRLLWVNVVLNLIETPLWLLRQC